MTREAYNALDGVNFSTMKELLRSPRHYQTALHEVREPEDEAKFSLGSAAHAALLEDADISTLFAIKPDGMKFTTNEGKMWKALQKLPILAAKDAASVSAMVAVARAHPDASAALAACPHREDSLAYRLDSVDCKGLLDAWGRDATGAPVIVDYKTTTDARPEAFIRSVMEYHYDLQMHVYRSLLQEHLAGEAPSFIWIVQEKTPPYAVNVFVPDDSIYESGRKKFVRCLNLLLTCRSTGEWPAYAPGIKPLSLPKWALKEAA